VENGETCECLCIPDGRERVCGEFISRALNRSRTPYFKLCAKQEQKKRKDAENLAASLVAKSGVCANERVCSQVITPV
jgi:hypothetical protein